VLAIWIGNIYLLYGVLLLMGTQSALFGPSKLGCIPELVREDRLQSANGWIGLSTIAAIMAGTVLGSYLYAWTGPTGQSQLWISAVMLLNVAGAGLITSLLIRPLPVANPNRSFPQNPVQQTGRDLSLLFGHAGLKWVGLAIAFFWGVGSLFQLNVDTFATMELGVPQQRVGPLLAALCLGIGFGSAAAGVISRGRTELGIVPLAAAGMAGTSAALYYCNQSYTMTAAVLFVLGVFGGLFDIPLDTYLQHKSPPERRGSMLAASNFITFAAMLAVSGVFTVLSDNLGLSAREIFVFAGVCTIPVVVIATRKLAYDVCRLVFAAPVKLVYRLRIEGLENLPEEGGALLTPNHVSWADGLLLLVSCPRRVHMVAYADYVNVPGLAWLARVLGIIPIKPESGPKSVARSLAEARAALGRGELVCMFPEGGLTRDGQLQEFRPGIMRIIAGGQVPVVPVRLIGLWGSIFSYDEGKFLWKWPRRWPFPVTIRFGIPIAAPRDVDVVRQAVVGLGQGT
jgi:acyl-[acyl-carrier-protein]-phospholipid O-acyltransferase/long-chain-fatty-acid--[acyl-carrier-protein] ligase